VAFGNAFDTTIVVQPRPPEDLVIGAATVPAARVDFDLLFSGQFEGTGRYRSWLDPVTGMFLRVDRVVDAQGDTPLGKQRYIEQSTMSLVSLSPGT
jgi:hypothetical protein